MKKYLCVLFGVLLLPLCSCFSRSAQVADFGESFKTVYERADDGSEYVTIYGDVSHNSALVMPKLGFAAKQDAIHIDITLELIRRGTRSLDFPWRIPLSKQVNRITFGPENEIIWERGK